MAQAAGELVRVLVASDRPAVWQLFRHLGERDPALEIVRAPDLAAAPDERWPGGAVGVIDMAEEAAATLARVVALRRSRPALRLLAIAYCSHCTTETEVARLFAAGLGGAVTLRASAREVAEAVHNVARGLIVHRLDAWPDPPAAAPPAAGASLVPPAGLGEHLELVRLVARGLTDAQIATALRYSEHTIRHQVRRVCQRIGVCNRTELAAWAGRAGLYDGSPETPAAPGVGTSGRRILASGGG